jgi:hypothetical protein
MEAQVDHRVLEPQVHSDGLLAAGGLSPNLEFGLSFQNPARTLSHRGWSSAKKTLIREKVGVFPGGTLAVSSQVDFKCTLPVIAYSRRIRLQLPAGAVTVDGPQLFERTGSNESSYVNGRWLPVPIGWVSPDRSSYASVMTVRGTPDDQTVLLTDLRTGKQRQLWNGTGHVGVIGWGVDGLYFMLQPSSSKEQRSHTDLWVVDAANPASARPTSNSALSSDGSLDRALFSSDARVAGDAAWETRPGEGTTGDSVERIDVRSGNLSVWYTAPSNTRVFILGFDGQSRPILALYSSDASSTKGLLFLTGRDQTIPIAEAFSGSDRFASAFSDSRGIWFGSAGSLWLYRSGSFFKVADVPVGPVGAETPMPIVNAEGGTIRLPPPVVVGPCV